MKKTYDIMHGEKRVARIDMQGNVTIYEPSFLPYSLYLEETNCDTDIDDRVNNVTNFYYWCATRVLTLDRKYAKEILNSIGASQAVTDKDRAQIALSYHCLSLTDIFWVKEKEENITFHEINLYENHLNNAFVDISLRGKQMTVQNSELAQDLATDGCFPKAWIRTEKGFCLLKGGGEKTVENEVLASKICQCFSSRQVRYREEWFEGEKVSVSDILTNLDYSIVSREAFEIHAQNQEIDAHSYILKLDGESYYRMNILDYLVGNTDRHWGNWGFLVDNKTNQPVCLHPLMDFNQAFHAYDTIDGANCQTVFPQKKNQREAALEAVRQVGLAQEKEIDCDWFLGRKAEYEMLMKRLAILKEQEKLESE
ncbi:MAG: hypothetical protein ACI4HI_03695 [Lachnospiraceae bacterium]